jgi:outer membrane protein assembly factor BamD
MRMKSVPLRVAIPLWAAVALLACSCAGPMIAGNAGVEAEFVRGQRLFDEGRYLQAVEALEAFRTEHPGSDRVDDAILLLGKAHQKMGENILARDEFDRLLRDFPQSDHREEAQFERAMGWLADSHSAALDPEPTQAALDAFRAYLRNYPDGAFRAEAEKRAHFALDRLAAKAYLNGETYLMLRQPAAARIYFQKSLSILNGSSRAADALLGLARASELLGEGDKAKEYYSRLLEYLTPERVGGDGHLQKLRERAAAGLGRPSAEGGRSS